MAALKRTFYKQPNLPKPPPPPLCAQRSDASLCVFFCVLRFCLRILTYLHDHDWSIAGPRTIHMHDCTMPAGSCRREEEEAVFSVFDRHWSFCALPSADILICSSLSPSCTFHDGTRRLGRAATATVLRWCRASAGQFHLCSAICHRQTTQHKYQSMSVPTTSRQAKKTLVQAQQHAATMGGT